MRFRRSQFFSSAIHHRFRRAIHFQRGAISVNQQNICLNQISLNYCVRDMSKYFDLAQQPLPCNAVSPTDSGTPKKYSLLVFQVIFLTNLT